MYQFSIAPYFCNPVTATIDSRWSEAALLELSGDSYAIYRVVSHLNDYGMTPDGRLVNSIQLAPMDLHLVFNDAVGFLFDPIKGKWLVPSTDRDGSSFQSVIMHQEAVDDMLEISDWLSQDFWTRDRATLKAIRDQLVSLRRRISI